MGDKILLQSALFYHGEGLNVIPVREREKAPATEILGGTWEQYQQRCSTINEIQHWWGNGFAQKFNIGIVHMDGYITIDVDHDKGIFQEMKQKFPELFKGRIEQSGSYEGYHIPLRVEELPAFGQDSRQGRPRGNKTWKTDKGDVNIRVEFCQTLSPPSLHPTGRRYRFIQKGELIQVETLSPVVCWLDELLPQAQSLPIPKRKTAQPTDGNTLIDAVKAAWKDPMIVFQEFGLLSNGIEVERNGDFRLLGNGGLLVTEDRQKWYCFSDEVGGGLFEAWGYCRMGSAYDNSKHFRQILIEMAQAAGIEPEKLNQREEKKEQPKPKPDTRYWANQFVGYWEKVR